VSTFNDLYPFKSNYLDIEGQRYHYLDEGPEDAPVLLMLHGNPTWSFYYRDLVKVFRETYRVVVPDHIGCGYSSKPQTYSYRLKTHIDNVERLLDHLSIGAYTLVCHDWGGPIGFGTSIRRPNALQKMVIFNTTCTVTDDYPKRILMCLWPLVGPVGIRGLNFFATEAVRHACCNRDRMTPEVKAGYLKPYDSYANRVANLRFVQDIPLSPSHPSYEEAMKVEKGFPELAKKPTMISWGMKDFCFTPAFLQEFRKAAPDAEVHEFADAGHYVVEDASDRIIPLMKSFLA